jgi:hypothetical protein
MNVCAVLNEFLCTRRFYDYSQTMDDRDNSSCLSLYEDFMAQAVMTEHNGSRYGNRLGLESRQYAKRPRLCPHFAGAGASIGAQCITFIARSSIRHDVISFHSLVITRCTYRWTVASHQDEV